MSANPSPTSPLPRLEIELPPQTRAALDGVRRLPDALVAAIKRGMELAADATVGRIQAERLVGRGPFPVEEHRLGVRTSQLLRSLRRAAVVAVREGENTAVATAIGTPLRYARIHELGGEITRTTRPGSVRLRTDKRGELIRRGGLAVFARRKKGAHKLYREVSYAGGKTYKIRIPARAPIGHGLADHAPLFTREIAAQVAATLKTATA